MCSNIRLDKFQREKRVAIWELMYRNMTKQTKCGPFLTIFLPSQSLKPQFHYKIIHRYLINELWDGS